MNDTLIKETKRNIKFDKRLADFVSIYFLVQAANLAVKLWLGEFTMWSMLSKGILAVFLLIALPGLLRRNICFSLSVEIVVTIGFLSAILMETSGRTDILSIMFNSLVVYVPLGLCVYNVSNYDVLLKRLYLFSWPTQIILIVVSLNMTASLHAYYMPLGYALLFQGLIVADHYQHCKKWYDLLFLIIDLIAIVLVGSRGPLVCIATYIILQVLFSEKMTSGKRVKWIFFALFVLILFIIFYKDILIFISGILDSMGVSSRTIRTLANMNFTDSGRANIYSQSWETVLKRPVIGWGLTGGWTNSMYPHNIFLELVMSYGLFLGLICSILWIYTMFSGIRQSDFSRRRLAHILVSITISLLFSDSFIMNQTFFMCLAICLQGNRGFRYKRRPQV